MADQKSGLLYENLRKLINTIDELRDVGLQEYINLPRIAVVGTQSAGKSSLLESIVGMDFLPRGEGVVTRRPLELRLIHVSFGNHDDIFQPLGGSDFKPYAVFPPEEEKYYDFSKVYLKIQELTDKVCGTSKDIVDNPITMKIFSQTCPDLTIIDLPGITRIPMAGQSKDIEKVTKGMCRRYASDNRTIILAVVPANADMSTSDALLMAQEEDPEGIRTIGVITKIDIMDKGTNAKKMLLGQEIPLRLGYVGVKGRSQLDIQNNMKVSDAIKIEKDFFLTHPVYSTLPPGYVGTESLSGKLTKVLFGHIRATLPDIVKEIQIKIKECEERLRDLGEPLPSTTKEKMQLIWNMCTDYVENFKNNIRGKFDQKRNARVIKDFSGGAKIKMMFQDLYRDFFGKNPTENLTDEQIRRAIVLHQGDSIPGFPSLDSFLFLLGPLLKKLRDPAYELLNNVHMYLEELSGGLVDKIFFRFPGIIDEIHEITNKALKDERDIAQTLIENVIESEQAYIFTNDLVYMSEKTSMNPVIQQLQQQQQPTVSADGKTVVQQPPKKIDPEKIIVDEIRSRIDSYFCIVLRNIRDSIPKIIGHFLVKAIQENLQYCLYNELNKSEHIMSSIGEPPHITAERETLNKVLEVLHRAKRVLTKDPDLAPQFSDPKIPSISSSNTKITNSSSDRSTNVTGHNKVEESKSKDDSIDMTTSNMVTKPNNSFGQGTTTSRQTNPQVSSNPTKDVFGDSLKQPFQSTNPSTNTSTLNTSTVSSTSDNKAGGGNIFSGSNTNPSSGSSGSSNPFGNPTQTQTQTQSQPQPKPNPPKKTGLFG